MLKFFWLLLGTAALAGALWLATQEYAWRKQELRRRFSAYLETTGGRRYPIVSEETVVGRSRRAADVVLTVPGARTKGQKAGLQDIAPCHLEVFRRDGSFRLRNLHPRRSISLLRDGKYLELLLPPGRDALLVHGDEIRLTDALSVRYYEGEVL